MNSEEIIKYYELAKEYNSRVKELNDWIEDNFTDELSHKILNFHVGVNEVYDDALKLVSEANKMITESL